MGAWGMGIFEDDTALDVRDIFAAAEAVGLTPELATERVFIELNRLFDYGDVAFPAWLALAELQLEREALQLGIREQVLELLEQGDPIERDQDRVTADEMTQRQAILDDLRARLLAATPTSP